MTTNPGTTLVPFNGGEIRTIEYGRQTVAYMPDVAKTFGLRPNNVIPTLDSWDYVALTAENSAVTLTSENGRPTPHPSPYWLTESGVWHLTYKVSPELRRKVNEEVLPAMRKTGKYEAAPTPRTPRRKRIAGPGTPFPEELTYLKDQGANRVKLPSGFEIEFDPDRMIYATEKYQVARVALDESYVAINRQRTEVGLMEIESKERINKYIHDELYAAQPRAALPRRTGFENPEHDPDDGGYPKG